MTNTQTSLLRLPKNLPHPGGGQGGRIGVANNFGGNTSVRDQCVRVALILGHIYPQYEFKVIFLVAYPPLVTPVGNHFTIGLELKKIFLHSTRPPL